MHTPRCSILVSIAVFAFLAFAGSANAATAPVLLGTADPFGLLAGSTITNTGNSVINGELGLFPGTSLTGFPPGIVNGATHLTDAVANQAKTDLVTAYQDAAGRPLTASIPPDIGGSTLTSGVYRTGSVKSLQLTGAVTLDGQGDPNAVFIFQVESTLTTATDSSVSLVNGAQACNIFWQVGTSATLGTRTAFAGTIFALTSISVSDAASVQGRLLARNGAITLINNTVTRSACAAGTGGGGGGAGAGGGGGGVLVGPGPDRVGPVIKITGPPVPASTCLTQNFTARVIVSDRAGIALVRVYLDGRLIRTSRTGSSFPVRVRGLRVGRHVIKVVASDRAGNTSVRTRAFARCTIAVAAPRFAG